MLPTTITHKPASAGEGSGSSRRRRPGRHLWAFIFPALVIGLLSGGCAAVTAPPSSPAGAPIPARPPAGDEALLSLFIQLAEPDGPALVRTLAAIDLLAADGAEFALLPAPLTLESAAIAGGQRFAARQPVPAGRYRYLRLSFAAPRSGSEPAVMPAGSGLKLPLPGDFRLAPGESQSLFLHWDPAAALDPARPRQAWRLQPATPPLLTDLAFISAPEIDTVYLLRTDNDHICGSFAVAGRPTRLAYDDRRRHLYVLAAGAGAVQVVEAATGRTVDRLTIPLTTRPSFLLLAADGQSLYLLDEDDNLLLFDLARGAVEQRRRLGFGARYLHWLPDGTLALAASASREIYRLDPATLAVLTVWPVQGDPAGLLAAADLLFVAENDADTVGVYRLHDGQPVTSIATTGAPYRLVAAEQRVYVSNRRGRTISLLSMRPPGLLREIATEHQPGELATATGYRRLYAADSAEGLTIIDQGSQRVTGRVELGTRAGHLVIID
ncbi:YncE family protein [Desulfurivibrio alkaliphilus]|uniref:YncE family protein n=1 Tax=Desulfurivibrio alkaliphilus (strain DSM 19089 / UNIQEM U267 / AHT2) TaxID=589865 RepID=D6Z1M9_DESAT|nr:hypothetical protein [Desulfurivibrio alkaliphilus]ADH85454.1 hypothetical protein DaAHT2_0750 [Desulfurivibrio alkaliphilus AHT 2]